jgi:glycosyltransferase involved in cell wall biosynthesis
MLNSLNGKVRLTIIGEGPEERRVINFLGENHLRDKVELLKHVPNSRMREYYSRADLFLLFSKIEAFGMVILEAMACGCFPVAGDLESIREWIKHGENGF